MSLKKKSSSASLQSNPKYWLRPSADELTNASLSDYDSASLNSVSNHRMKRMSTIFQRSRTDDSLVTANSGRKNNLDSESRPDTAISDIHEFPVPLPRASSVSQPKTGPLYSLGNDSSGTLRTLRISSDNRVNNVEFNNIRSNSMDTDSLNSPSSASLMDKTKESKLGRFISRTTNKVKKMSDIGADHISLGLGLNSHHNQRTIDKTSGPSNKLQTTNTNSSNSTITAPNQLTLQPLPKAFAVSSNNKELKSPLSRSFSTKNESKLTLGEKLKLLNSTKYKNYHYHNLIRNKKESFKNGIKLGSSKNNDFSVDSTSMNNNVTSSSFALHDINYSEIDRMIDNDALNFEQCDIYCAHIFPRIKNLLLPLFKGEMLQAALEDVTKLVCLYVRLRKTQETIMEKEHKKEAKTFENSLNITDDPLIEEFETPFMKPSAVFGSDINSPVTSFSPLVKVRAGNYSAIKKILEEVNDILKFGMIVMINQLYYEEITDTVTFIRGSNSLLRKRHNTLSSLSTSSEYSNNHDDIMSNSFNLSTNSMYASEMTHTPSSTNLMDLPILTPIQTHNSVLNNDYKTSDNFTGHSKGNVTGDAHNQGYTYGYNHGYGSEINGETQHELLNLGLLPVGRFDKCISILWDIFQTNVLYELNCIFLPIELEFANGHREISRIHNLAESIIFNKGNKIRTFTNTLVYPDIIGSNKTSSFAATNEDNDMGIVGSLGEWTDINIRNVLLVGFRDYVVIPLYEMNRKYEDDNERMRADTRASKDNGNAEVMREYSKEFLLLQCFRVLTGVRTQDTNQKLIDNLLVQTRERVAKFER